MGELLCSMYVDLGAVFAIWARGGVEMPRASGARAAHNERSRAPRTSVAQLSCFAVVGVVAAVAAN